MRTRDVATGAARATGPDGVPGPRHGGQADELGVTVYDVARDLRRDVAAVELPLAIEGAPEAAASRGVASDSAGSPRANRRDSHPIIGAAALRHPAAARQAGADKEDAAVLACRWKPHRCARPI